MRLVFWLGRKYTNIQINSGERKRPKCHAATQAKFVDIYRDSHRLWYLGDCTNSTSFTIFLTFFTCLTLTFLLFFNILYLYLRVEIDWCKLYMHLYCGLVQTTRQRTAGHVRWSWPQRADTTHTPGPVNFLHHGCNEPPASHTPQGFKWTSCITHTLLHHTHPRGSNEPPASHTPQGLGGSNEPPAAFTHTPGVQMNLLHAPKTKLYINLKFLF